MEDDIRLFFCYSVELRNYLYEQGIKYRVAAVNPNSQKMFWMYFKNDKLDKALTAYHLSKPADK